MCYQKRFLSLGAVMKIIVNRLRSAVTCLLVFVPLIGSAHHSRATYSDEVRELEGELLSVIWRNPHPAFTLKTVTAEGQEEIWRIEAFGSVYLLGRTGVTRDRFKIGDHVKLAGRPSIRGPREFLGTHMLLSDGLEVILDMGGESYWSGRYVGGGEEDLAYEGNVVDAAAESRGIFRVWSAPGGVAAERHYPFTAAAVDARATWDVLDNFVMRCEQPGMAFAMTAPWPFEFIDRGDELIVRGSAWDVTRIIHMDGSEGSDAQATSHFGYSTGHWEGNTLVVETTQMDWPYFDDIGTPLSEAAKIVERFTLSEDQSRLDQQMTTTDPATFTESATYERYWLALGETVPAYDCQVF